MEGAVQQKGIWISTGDPETVNDVDLYAEGNLGKVVTIEQGGVRKTYRLVRANTPMAVVPFANAVAWWASTSLYTVTTDLTVLGQGRVAGIFRFAVSINNYCFIQIRGPSTVRFLAAPSATPTAAGLVVVPSATAAEADAMAQATGVFVAAVTGLPSMGVTTSGLTGNDANVDLHLPETID